MLNHIDDALFWDNFNVYFIISKTDYIYSIGKLNFKMNDFFFYIFKETNKIDHHWINCLIFRKISRKQHEFHLLAFKRNWVTFKSIIFERKELKYLIWAPKKCLLAHLSWHFPRCYHSDDECWNPFFSEINFWKKHFSTRPKLINSELVLSNGKWQLIWTWA